MSSVFISYRRDDSADVTGRIFDRLRLHFEQKLVVFRDVDNIPLGRDFREVITKAVESCKVLLAIIGPSWVENQNEDGERRLDDPNDFVRLEIETALNRNIAVIPLLVSRAGIPKAAQLPESLQQLAFRAGLEIRRDPDFHNDMDRLIRALTAIIVKSPSEVNNKAKQEQSEREAIEKSLSHESVLAREKEQKEIELARKVQLGFLPQILPEIIGYEFFSYYSPAETVGGNYYDFVPLPGGRCAVVLGDVAGKGVPAALLVAKLSSEVRFCFVNESNPAKAVSQLNDQMLQGGLQDRFVTLAALFLDPHSHQVVVVNAGHMSPKLYVASKGTIRDTIMDEDTGPAIGFVPGFQYEAVTINLEPGDVVSVYTDGVTDAVNQSGVFFGTENVDKYLTPEDSLPPDVNLPKHLGEQLVTAVHKHTNGHPQNNDITVVCFGRLKRDEDQAKAENEAKAKDPLNPSRSRTAGEKIKLKLPGDVPLSFAWCPPGTFQMGSNNSGSTAEPVHSVKLTKGFYLGIHQVTQAQWESVMGTEPSRFKGPNRPVEQVSWMDAVEFCAKLNMKLSSRGQIRLPSEAEWEYSCRAGTATGYYTGFGYHNLLAAGWFVGNSGKETHPVGQLKANAWNLYDMHGNVMEWCGDWLGKYSSDQQTDPIGPLSGSFRVVRGGSWSYEHNGCRSDYRHWYAPSDQRCNLGFRVALVLKGS